MDAVHVPGRIEPDGRRRSLSERLYGRLLAVYPGEFRARYGTAMVQLFADQLRDARRAGPIGLAAAWTRALTDLGSNALGEHLRKDRTMAQSLSTFEPTRSMRLLGLIGLVGAVLLLLGFVAWFPFVDRTLNELRILLFWIAGLAIALALHARQADPPSSLAIVATGVVVAANAWNVAWVVLAWDRASPFSGFFGEVGFYAGLSGWLGAAFYGAATLYLGRVWRGMSRVGSIATRLGVLALLVGSPLALLGMDRLGVGSQVLGGLVVPVAQVGVALNGAGWLLLALVLILGGRRGRAAA